MRKKEETHFQKAPDKESLTRVSPLGLEISNYLFNFSNSFSEF